MVQTKVLANLLYHLHRGRVAGDHFCGIAGGDFVHGEYQQQNAQQNRYHHQNPF